MNTILHERQLEEYYCTLCYAFFDLAARTVTLANSGLPFPIRCSRGECAEIVLPGVPLGSFPGVTYDEVTLDLHEDDLFVFCTDGILEAMDGHGAEFGADRLLAVIERHRDGSPTELVEAVFRDVNAFRDASSPADDMTIVAARIGKSLNP
jgi:sigma-B regulation protein RsbU (phosphoserine phosphatase)